MSLIFWGRLGMSPPRTVDWLIGWLESYLLCSLVALLVGQLAGWLLSYLCFLRQLDFALMICFLRSLLADAGCLLDFQYLRGLIPETETNDIFGVVLFSFWCTRLALARLVLLLGLLCLIALLLTMLLACLGLLQFALKALFTQLTCEARSFACSQF